MPSTSKAAAICLAFVVAGCARNAPSLPPDLSHLPATERLLAGDLESAEGKLDCGALENDSSRSRALSKQLEEMIASKRGQNQAVGYFSALLFPPLLLAAEHSAEAKKVLDDEQAKRDRIDRLSRAKACAPRAIN